MFPLARVVEFRYRTIMMYDKEVDFPRLVGKALEAADKAAATNRQLPLSITLDPGTKRAIKVQCKDEPRLPDVLKFAQSGKAYINGVLKEEGMVLRSPLDFRGQGPWPARPAARLPALKEVGGGGVQITAENREYGEVSVDLRFAVATEDNQWWTCNVEQKFSQKSLQAAVALAEGNVNWVANKRFEISKFKFKIPRARTSELQGSFSAVSKPNFASKYSLESSRRDLHNALLCTAL